MGSMGARIFSSRVYFLLLLMRLHFYTQRKAGKDETEGRA